MKSKQFVLISLMAFALMASATAVVGGENVIYADLATAIKESGLDMTKVLHFDPVEYRDGVATYKIWQHGSKAQMHALVAASMDPMRPDLPSHSQFQKAASASSALSGAVTQQDSPVTSSPTKIISHPSSGRCTISLYRNVNFNGGIVPTNLDWNHYPDFVNQTNFNDNVSSLRTGCNPILIYPHKNFGGGGLFFPSNASIPDLSVYSFNDKASSHFIYCQ